MPKKVIILFLVVALLSALVFTALFVRFRSDDGSIQMTDFSDFVDSITTADFEFKELTIPYLRSQNYESSLSQPQLYLKSSQYDSYLTSFLSDGFKVNALLTVPNTQIPEGGFPSIVFLHGYIPPDEYITTERYVLFVDYLARNGFVVLKIDFRGHGNSEGQANGAYFSSDYVVDTLNAINALSKFEKVNPEKIGIWGHSMAGNVGLRTVAVKKDIPAAVFWAGAGYTYQDFATYGIGDNSYRPPTGSSERARKRQLLNSYYGEFDENSWFWKMVPATNYLDGIKTNIELHHSIDDQVVNVNYSRDLKKILDEKKIPSNYFEYNFGGHNISGSSFDVAMQRTVNFFKERM